MESIINYYECVMAYCNECGRDIKSDELEYSEKRFMRPLCRDCQHGGSVYIGTPQQQKLCRALREVGYQAYTEWSDGVKHIDIAIPDAMFHIEVDGSQHSASDQAIKDLGRTYYSFKNGYYTLRIPNSLVENDFDNTVSYIVNLLKESRDQLVTLSNLEQTPSGRVFSGIKIPSDEVIWQASKYLEEYTPFESLQMGNIFYDKSTNRFIVSYLGEWSTDEQLATRDFLLENFGIDIDFQEI